MALFKGKNNFDNVSDFDLDYMRYFNEYYPDADVDVMIKSSHPLDFIKKVKIIFNQVVVNICGFNPANAEPHHVKMITLKTVFLFVTHNFIREKIVTKEISFEYIINNLKEENVIELFKPYFDKKIKEFNDNIYEEYSPSEYNDIIKKHPELFDDNITSYQIHISNKKEDSIAKSDVKIDNIEEEDFDKLLDDIDDEDIEKHNLSDKRTFDDIGINISYKVKIKSNHIQRPLELFSVLGEDFFGLVSKFHLPCVRAYYDGNNVYLTPSCITAHMTYMNLDYKYFAGSNDEINIILKYRMRGFGTMLNRNELDKLIKYASKILFWNRLYNINLDNHSSIVNNLGCMSYQDKVFHPRLYNADLYDPNISYVNINDGYNTVKELPKIKTLDQMKGFITCNLKGFEFTIDLMKFQTIGNDGFIMPVQKWLIDSIFHLGHLAYNNELKNEEQSIFDDEEISKLETKPSISPIKAGPMVVDISEPVVEEV